jgi:Rrf2 family nitric oxide-sensitive transcriptional repressor
MRLTKFTDLALRVTMLLAVADAEETPTARDVADAVAAPYSHVAKVVSRLQHLGVLEARRGRGGGLALTGFGRDASVGWLVRELEGVGEVVGCEDAPPCPLRAVCRLRGLLRQAQEAFYATLDPVTVRELTAAPAQPTLVRLLASRPG